MKSLFGNFSAIWKQILGLSIIILTVSALGLGIITWQFYALQARENIIEKQLLRNDFYGGELIRFLNETIYYNQRFRQTADNLLLEKSQSVWNNKAMPYLDSLSKSSRQEEGLTAEQDKRLQKIRQDFSLLETILEGLKRETDEKTQTQEFELQIVYQRLNRNLELFLEANQIDIRLNLSQNRARLQTIYLIFIVFVVVITLIGFFYVIRILNGLQKGTSMVTQALQAVAQGEVPDPLPVKFDEVENLVLSANAVLDNLEQLKKLAQELSQGNYDTQLRVFDDKGELGEALAAMRSNLEHITTENEERNWINEGLAMFAEILRGDTDDTQAFYDEIISNLVTYLGVNQGGFFVVENQGDAAVLRLVSTFAFNHKKYIQKEVGLGEGLVGRAWREKDSIYLTEIPEDYVEISSGLGSAKPNSILIFPLISENKVYGVIELASFEPLEEYKQDLVKRLSESIAVTIARAQIDTRDKVILENSKVMSKQLKEQEYLIRQNLQEITQIRQNLMLTQVDLETRLRALNESFCMTEMDTQGRYLLINRLMCETVGYAESEILGKHYTILLREKAKTVVDTWQSIVNTGLSVRGEFIRYRKNGEKIWFYEIVYPLIDAEGKVQKVYSIGFDITKQKQQEFELKRRLAVLQTKS